MIRVNEDGVIDVDNYSYALQRDMHRTAFVKVDGKLVERPVYKSVGYFATLDQALNRLLDEDFRERFKDGEHTLEEAIRVTKECREAWEDLIKRCMNG